ncbi:MAG: GtrA family protein [Candidatus Sulfotelmatobacter sp.]
MAHSLSRLLRFDLTTGGVSIAGNLAVMKLLIGMSHVNYLLANGTAIAVCSLRNFLVSEGSVFADKREGESKNLRAKLAVRTE